MKNQRIFILIVAFIMIGLLLTSCKPLSGFLAMLSPITGKDCDMKLFSAIDSHNLEATKEAVKEGANINLFKSTNLIKQKLNPVLYAMQNSCDRIVEYLLDQKANPNYIDSDGISLLMYAAGAQKQGVNNDNIVNIDYCKLLLNHGANINQVGKIGYTALDYACRDNGNDPTVKFLLDFGAQIRPKTFEAALEGYKNGTCDEIIVKEVLESLIKNGNKSELDPILEASILGDSAKVCRLIKANKIAKQDEQQILIFTVAFGNEETLQLLIDKGVDMNSYDNRGYSLLSIACEYGQIDIVKYLISKGADIVTTHNNDGETALTKAVRYNQVDIAEYLINHGAKLQVYTNSTSTDSKPQNINVDALKIASQNGNVNLITWIIKNGYPLNQDHSFYAMEAAAENNQLSVLQYFLDNGVNINIEYQESTVIDDITAHGTLETVKFLVEHGANVDGGKVKGIPLFFAATYGRTDIANYLIGKGANVNAITVYSDDSKSDSILAAAINSGSFDIVKSLVTHGANLKYQNGDNKKTAVEIAEGKASKNIVEYLKQKLATVTTTKE